MATTYTTGENGGIKVVTDDVDSESKSISEYSLVQDPLNQSLIYQDSSETGDHRWFKIRGNYMYTISNDRKKVQSFDISDPFNPQLLDTVVNEDGDAEFTAFDFRDYYLFCY